MAMSGDAKLFTYYVVYCVSAMTFGLGRNAVGLATSDNTTNCPTNWAYYNGHCYILQDSELVIEEAREACLQMGADLVIIEDAEENAFLSSLLPESTLAAYWIGLMASATNGNGFTWLDGTVVRNGDGIDVGYTNWQPGEPIYHSADNCAEITTENYGRGYVRGAWNDEPCDIGLTHGYICESNVTHDYCQEDETNDPYPLTWPQTKVGHVAESTERCPEYSGTVGPRGSRQCKDIGDLISAPKWQDLVINDCFGDDSNQINEVLTELSQNTVTQDNVTQISSDLAEATNITSAISATGLEAVAMTLESIINVQSPSPEVTISVIDTVDNILNIEEEVFEAAVDKNASTRILITLVEQLSFFQKQGMNFTVSRTNINVQAVQIPRPNLPYGIGFANIVRNSSNVGNTEIFYDPEDISVHESDTSIALPSEVVSRSDVNETTMLPVTFILYQNTKLFQSRRLEDESTINRVRLVGTRVISATIEGSKVFDLAPDQPIISTYLHKQSKEENNTLDNFQCVFWDFDLENGQGDWSNEGCRLVEITETGRIICHCDHLTSFAVLVDVYGQRYSTPRSTLVLVLLSKIGCGVSISALLIALITYLAIKSQRTKKPKQILICLFFTLLCLYVVFVIGVKRTDSYAGCIAVAALLHYLTLSSVSWMGVEGVNLYLLIVQVFNADVSNFLLKASLAAWGVPLIPVIIVMAIDYTQYVNEHYCFMQPSYAFYFADLLIIAFILIFNFVMFMMIMYKLTCGRKDIGRSSSRDKKQYVTRGITAVAITAILGLTWVFGFLTIIENHASSLVFQVLFCIFNSLQGFFIFILFCVRDEEIRDEWKRWLACGQRGTGTEMSSSGRTGHSETASSDTPKSNTSV
ncbi:adhesion G-protein coupled receptor G6-like [Amphiura filiformis]|uniref:adhesion G-protein coupled receptor G6-like n=1 Tax=Amphiura filiformis TaxID=82378 RepID=UPI003B210E3C